MSWPRRTPPADPSQLIDRNPQNLPLPVGGFSVLRRRRIVRVNTWWKRNAPTVVGACGVVAAVVGAAFVWAQPPIAVFSTSNTIHIGKTVLTAAQGVAVPEGATLYLGDASYLLIPQTNGAEVATAVADLHGRHITGRCEMAASDGLTVTEHCDFTVAGEAFSADDRLDFSQGSSWDRHYSDGEATRIDVGPQGGVVPAPLPIGH